MSEHSEDSSATLPAGCMARIYWIFVGNAIPAFAALMLATRKADVLLLSVVFWLGVIALLVVRWYDICYLHGKTADHAPANMGTWARYALLVTALAAALYGAALAIRFLIAPTSPT